MRSLGMKPPFTISVSFRFSSFMLVFIVLNLRNLNLRDSTLWSLLVFGYYQALAVLLREST